MHDSSPSNRRKTLIILPDLQRRIVLGATLWPLIMTLGAGALVASGLWIVSEQMSELELSVPGLSWLGWSLAGFTVLAASVILAQALLFSHRIAGPIYRLQVSMQRVTDGEVGFRVKLRDKDLLQETAMQMNAMLDALEQRSAESPTRPVAADPNVTPQSLEVVADA